MRYIAIVLVFSLGACAQTPEQQANWRQAWMMYQATKPAPVQNTAPTFGGYYGGAPIATRTTNCYTMANTINCTSY